jgi:hypothetical protein
MVITKKVGDFDLIESGSIVINQSNTISFFILNLEVEFVFSDTEDKKQEIKVSTIDNKKLQLNLLNFNNTLGTGITKPMSVATLNTGEEVFLQYVVYAVGELKVLHYSWYSKPVVEDSSVVTLEKQ